MTKSISFIFLVALFSTIATQAQSPNNAEFPYQSMAQVLPGTKVLDWNLSPGDLATKMLNDAHQYINNKMEQSKVDRPKFWQRNVSSKQAYETSVEPIQKSFMKHIGVEDKSKPPTNYDVGLPDKNPQPLMEKIAINGDPEIIAETSTYRVYQVRWPVLNRVWGEGLLIQPKSKPLANIIALPDADQTPEQLFGLSPGIPASSQFARQLAENGYQVLIPVLISRSTIQTGTPTEQTYREWIYRQAFHMGRHLIGYEVEKVSAAIDWFKQSEFKDLKTGVAGYCEGGLIAFYSAAVDKRIDAVLVSGYFTSRENVWNETIYRNVFGLLTEFGDAEIASLIAPRPMIIEYSPIPEQLEKSTAKPANLDEFSANGYKGSLRTPAFKDVQDEFNRIDQLTRPGFQPKFLIHGEQNKPIAFGSKKAIEEFTDLLGHKTTTSSSKEIPVDNRKSFNAEDRQIRQVKELEDHVQWLLRVSDIERNNFLLYKVLPEINERVWSTKSYHPYYSPDHFIEEAKKYQKIFNEEILGKFEDSLLTPNPRTRKFYDKEKWTGYEVAMDVYPNFFAAGILLIPKDLKQGERRPVVVCQVGRNGLPQDAIEGNTSYNDIGTKLADQGFIVYCPYVLYRGEDRYRWLDRKANTIGKTLFSFIISQHEQTLRWLGSLSFVDKNRIAFYGKSYGGETAMRIPSVLEGYCLSICSGDFGDWTRKVVDTHFKGGFMNTIEWEMPYFSMGNTFSYAEMAYLILPRPFMVERGHDDLVQPDEWVGYEYAKVKYLYDRFNLGDNTRIEFFNGGHSSKNDQTFEFLHKHLKWP